MKQGLFFIVLLGMSFQAFSETLPGITPVLKYSESALVEASKEQSRHLAFVPEEVSFPDGPQKEKFEMALSIMEEVMNSEEFKRKVIAYENSLGQREYQKNFLWDDSSSRLSNEDVYQVIMNGEEKMRPRTFGEMNFNSWVKICKWWQKPGIWCRKVIGSTSPSSSKWIKLNWKFYSRYEVPSMVANMVHEWLHLLGFLHGNVRMHEEVPYVVGSIAGEVAKNILDENRLY